MCDSDHGASFHANGKTVGGGTRDDTHPSRFTRTRLPRSSKEQHVAIGMRDCEAAQTVIRVGQWLQEREPPGRELGRESVRVGNVKAGVPASNSPIDVACAIRLRLDAHRFQENLRATPADDPEEDIIRSRPLKRDVEAKTVAAEGERSRYETIVRLQDERFHGFEAMVAAILAMAERRLAVLDQRRRETCPASDLVVGVQCGGSDAFSGVTANPAVGFCSDLLVRAGATVMFSEVTEVRDAVQLLTARCATPELGRAMVREMAWYDRYLAAGGIDRSANPSPGNKAGGLVNIVEKTLGCIAKSGTSAIADVLSHGERVRRKGLVFAATPAGDFVCGTMQLAAGMTVHVFTTGRGNPYGLAAAPVIKMATRTDLSARWFDLIDIDAGRIATGERTIEEVAWELFRLVLDVASGRTKTWAERWGLDNGLALFNPTPLV